MFLCLKILKTALTSDLRQWSSRLWHRRHRYRRRRHRSESKAEKKVTNVKGIVSHGKQKSQQDAEKKSLTVCSS
jgi:hypothetical protein